MSSVLPIKPLKPEKCSISNLLQQAYYQLLPRDTARIDAEVLLMHTLKLSRAALYTWPERIVSQEEYATFSSYIARRQEGEPIAYITQQREFWSLPLYVNKDVLIPRPETELLVELLLITLPADQKQTIVDLGTGCGAIALALAYERPLWTIVATDNRTDALKVAHYNAQRLQLNNIEFFLSEWLEDSSLSYQFDAVISNPPYLAANDPHLLQGDLRFEPIAALVPGSTGLEAYTQIIQQASKKIKSGGWLFLEHGYQQGAQLANKLKANGYQNIKIHTDLAGLERIIQGQYLTGC